jgi:hypothetical protein
MSRHNQRLIPRACDCAIASHQCDAHNTRRALWQTCVIAIWSNADCLSTRFADRQMRIKHIVCALRHRFMQLAAICVSMMAMCCIAGAGCQRRGVPDKGDWNSPVMFDAPTVVVQERDDETYYVIPSTIIDKFQVSPQMSDALGSNTVMFVISDTDVPGCESPGMAFYEAKPSILIHHPARRTSYFLTHEELVKLRGKLPKREFEKGRNWSVAFCLPPVSASL